MTWWGRPASRPGRPFRASGCSRAVVGYVPLMKLMRSAVLAGLAKKAYDEARKPENQRRIKEFVASMQQKQQAKRARGAHR